MTYSLTDLHKDLYDNGFVAIAEELAVELRK